MAGHDLPKRPVTVGRNTHSIIYQHDRSKTPSQMPVSKRVDAIIKSIVETRTQRMHLPDADFAALLCGIDLEQQHRQACSMLQTP
ncbi:hypothetical protein [Pseudomonas sp. WS 5011]|uniref:hypothetical protein n=1 Tax=Pseudomonas sp. WS 5011 TaxID=2717477 RepID=UPI0021CF82D0|nr:hypothetical protein [Pseudomonas sp. WS 5011]